MVIEAAGPGGWHSYTRSAMPIYEYRCDNGHTFEVMQRMTDDPVAVCPEDGAPVQRVFHPVAVHFKGKGFYNTDYGTRKRQRELKDSAEGGDGGSGGDKAAADKAAPKEKGDASSSSSSGDGGGSGSGSGAGGGSSSGSSPGSSAQKGSGAAAS